MEHIVHGEILVWGSTEINSETIAQLFNIFLCGVFYFLEDTNIASNVDNTTHYNPNLTQELVIIKLEESSSILSKWFNNTYMKVNSA